MKRRDFLKTAGTAGAAGAVGAFGGLAAASKNTEAAETPHIREYRRLGRTGVKISDISFGGGDLSHPSLMARAVDMGINYFDTAPDYGASEATIGKYLTQSGNRDKVYIATKFCSKGMYPAHLDSDAREADYITAVEESLRRMSTDYTDFIFVHAMGEGGRGLEARLFSEEMLNAYEKLKKAGKARFLAVSSHGPTRMEDLLMKAVRSGHYDVIMPAHNFMKFPNVPAVMKAAAAADVGVVTMKTLAGARAVDLDPGEEPFEHAAFKWVLNNPNVAGLIVTISNARDLAHYVRASGGAFTESSQRTLDKYMLAHSGEYCRTGCGDCLPACEKGVNVAGVLRQEMYFTSYRRQKTAMEAYAKMTPNAAACAGCADTACQKACPYGLRIKELLSLAHEKLTFNA